MPHDDESSDLSAQQLAELKRIRDAKNRLLVCFCTFPLYILGANSLARAGQDLTFFMLLYMLLYAGFGIAASVKRCPRCQEQFFVKAYFLNPFRNRCAHCAQPLKPLTPQR